MQELFYHHLSQTLLETIRLSQADLSYGHKYAFVVLMQSLTFNYNNYV